MLRLKDNARRPEHRQDRKEKVCLDQGKMDAALLKIKESDRRYTEEVDNRVNLFRDTTNNEMLQIRWLNFLALKIDNNPDYQAPAPTGPVGPRSRSLSRKPQRLCNLQQTWTRVQSLDREKMDEDQTLTFLRWSRAGESVLTKAGSPLSLPESLEERCAKVQIPTSKGTITMQPQKMMNLVNREVLMNLDQNTLA